MSYAGSGTAASQRRVTLRLPFEPTAPRTARRELTDFLAANGACEQVMQDAALVVSELSRNGILHGRADDTNGIEVSWALADDVLIISVADGGGESAPCVQAVDTYSASGRGLALVATVCRSWSVERERGTRVTAELALV